MKVIQFIRGLIPYQAPDVSPFERPLTDRELATYAEGFSSFRSKAFTLPTTSLVNVLPPLRRSLSHTCQRVDAAILQKFPSLGYYATARVVEMRK